MILAAVNLRSHPSMLSCDLAGSGRALAPPIRVRPPLSANASLFGSSYAAESPKRSQIGEQRLPALRFVRIHVEDDRNQEDQPLHGSHPRAGEAGGDEAGLDHS